MRPARLSHRLAAAGFTVAAMLVASATAHAADAVYGGSAPSGHAIVLKSDAKSTALRSLVHSWRADCADGSSVPGGGTLTATQAEPGFSPGPDELLVSTNAKGRFKGTQLASRDLGDAAAAIVVEVQGRLKPNRASGTTTVRVEIVDKATGVAVTSCREKHKWSATHAPGIVFGGTTSQGAPIVLRLNSARKRVNDVYVTWSAGCTDGGSYTVPDQFGNFTVKSGGTFGNPFDFSAPIPGGGTRAFGYTVSGKVGKAAAKGKVQVKVTETDAAGAPGAPCDSGAVTWKATSS